MWGKIHSMEHQQHNHSTTENIRVAFFLNLVFTLLEIAGGIWTNSLAILSDAIHDFGDSFSLGLAWYLDHFSQRENDRRVWYGYRRFSLLSALINTLVLISGSVIILSKAIPRLFAPESANAPGMAVIAVIGIVVNGAAVLRLRRERSMNARVVAWHLLEDVLGWVAVLVVSIVLLIADVYILDPILSILITLYVLYNTLRNLWKTASLFMQAVPDTVDMDQIDSQLQAIPEVLSTHHTHVWSLDGEHHVLTTHVVISEDTSKDDVVCIRREIQDVLREMAFSHTTVEIEFGEDDCGMEAGR
jgi:cobalt-zinc-cadmium efflux system protein